MTSTSDESKKLLFILIGIAILGLAIILRDHIDRLEMREHALEARLDALESRSAPVPDPKSVARTEEEKPPEVGAIVRFDPRRDPREMIVLASTKHARGEGCVPELDDARLAVLDVKDGWVLVRYNRLGAPASPAVSEPKACADGTVGAVTVEGFQSYESEGEGAAPDAPDRADDFARVLQLFVSAP